MADTTSLSGLERELYQVMVESLESVTESKTIGISFSGGVDRLTFSKDCKRS